MSHNNSAYLETSDVASGTFQSSSSPRFKLIDTAELQGLLTNTVREMFDEKITPIQQKLDFVATDVASCWKLITENL